MARDAFRTLAAALRIYFGQVGAPVTVSVGLVERFRLVNQGPEGANRIVIIPGRYNGEDPGAPLDGGTYSNRLGLQSTNPRELEQVNETVTLSIWGIDTSDLSDESLQMAAVQRLRELAHRAIHVAVDPVTGRPLGVDRDSEGNTTWREFTRIYHSLESAFGLELLDRLEIQGPLYDAPLEVVQPTVGTLSKQLVASTG